MKVLQPRLLAAKPKATRGWQPDSRRGNRHQRGYGWEWEKLRARILERDSWLCQACLETDRVTVATQVDHIIPKSQGGSDNEDNLQAICAPCHAEKTLKESGR